MACTSADLPLLANTPATLVAYLQSHDFSCVQYLWTYDTNVRDSYNNDNMDAVLAKIEALVPDQQLADGLDELRAQVYAINPPWYRDLDCAFSGPAQQLITQQGDKYLLRPVKVTVKVP